MCNWRVWEINIEIHENHISYKLYSINELNMISELFSRRSFIKILFSHLKILISRFRIIIYFTKILKCFSKIFRKNITFTPIPLTHPPYHTPTPKTPNCEPTQNFKNSLFSKTNFDYISTFISHTFQLLNMVNNFIMKNYLSSTDHWYTNFSPNSDPIIFIPSSFT